MTIKVTALGAAEQRQRHLAIGTFDGVHLGHRAVIDRADTVVVFDPHPRTVLSPDSAPKLIFPFSVRRDVLDGLGVAELVVISFDEQFSRLGPDEFIEQVLIERLGARKVSVGENFRFGAKGTGNPELLAARTEFETRIVPMIEIDGDTLSSTRIRERIETGDIATARRWLAGPFMVEGTVVEGERLGRALGFPTANLVPDDRLVVPGHGVYAAFANGAPAVVNVGVRPTFNSEPDVLVETHLLDRTEDLYDQTLRVAFLDRLRPELRFDRTEALIEQIRRDAEDAGAACAEFVAASAT